MPLWEYKALLKPLCKILQWYKRDLRARMILRGGTLSKSSAPGLGRSSMPRCLEPVRGVYASLRMGPNIRLSLNPSVPYCNDIREVSGHAWCWEAPPLSEFCTPGLGRSSPREMRGYSWRRAVSCYAVYRHWQYSASQTARTTVCMQPLRALSSLRGLRGSPEVPPLCRETSVSRTANVGTVGINRF